MALIVRVAGTDITSVVDPGSIALAGQAHVGEPTSGTFDVDDDAGTQAFGTYKIVTLEEDAPVGGPVTMARGRVIARSPGRGSAPMGSARRWRVSVNDQNMHFRGIRVQASRPAETDVQRVQWLRTTYLAGTPRASTNLATTYLSTSNPVAMAPKTYDRTDVYEVISDCAAVAGKEFFVTVDDELFYDLPTSTAYAAALSITDDEPDLETSFPPIWEGDAGTIDGSETYTAINLSYGANNNQWLADGPAIAAMDWWDANVQDDRTMSYAEAGARVSAMLGERKTDEERYRCSVLLRDDQVGLVKTGQTLSFRAAAAAISVDRTMRVSRIAWSVYGPGQYLAHLELGFPEKILPRLPSRGDPVAQAIDAMTMQAGLETVVPTGESFNYVGEDGGTWGGVVMKLGSWMRSNIPYTSCPCAPGLGGWAGVQTLHFAHVYPDGIDDDGTNVVAVLISISYAQIEPVQAGSSGPGHGHYVGCYYAGDGSPAVWGPYRLFGPSPTTDPNLRSGGLCLGEFGGALSETVTLAVNRNSVLYGGAPFTLWVSPHFLADGTFRCDSAPDSSGGIVISGFNVSLVKVPVGGRGWVESGAIGSQDGANRSFALPVGYRYVDRCTRNGQEIPSSAWSATDGTTVETIGWAPLATDNVLWRYWTERFA